VAPSPDRADVAVIGAGITGLFAALHLARRGQRVVVFERGRAMAEASGVNAGSLGVQNKLLPLVPLALAALEEWRGLAGLLGAEVGFVEAGGWRVACSEAERDLLAQSAAAQAALGVGIAWFEGGALRVRAPVFGPHVLAATYTAVDSYGSPLLLARVLREAAVAAGVVLHEHAPVTAIAPGSAWLVETAGQSLSAERVLVAAGPWTEQLMAPLGVALPLSLDVNMVSVTAPGRRFMPGIVFHARGILTVKQLASGACLIGGGWQGEGTLDGVGTAEIEYENLLHNLRLAARVLPRLRALSLVRHWAGFESVTPDALPYLGAVPDRPGLFVAAGTRGGWTLGPAIGRHLASLMSGDPAPALDAFSPARLQREAAYA
jgi:glycine/D-amino acid oxidase-like deaminating enzyme